MKDRETVTIEEVTLSREQLQIIEEIKKCLKIDAENKWRMGDLLLQAAGPSGEPDSYGKLAAVATQITWPGKRGQVLSWAARLRATSETFPPKDRTFDLPWEAYELTQKYPSLYVAILGRVVEQLEVIGYSRTLVRKIRNHVLIENGITPPPPDLNEIALFVRATERFRDKVERNKLVLEYNDAKALQNEWAQLQPLLRKALRASSRPSGNPSS